MSSTEPALSGQGPGPRPGNERARLLWFVLRVALLYLGLSLLWPAIEPGYARGFRHAGQVLFGNGVFGKSVSARFRDFPERPHQDVKVVLRSSDHPGKQAFVGINSERIAWFPTSFFLALLLATPGLLSRRWWRLPVGLLLVHGFVALRVYLALLLAFATRFGPRPALEPWIPLDLLEMGVLWLFDEVHSSYIAALLLWGLVAFRPAELLGPTGRAAPSAPPAGGESQPS